MILGGVSLSTPFHHRLNSLKSEVGESLVHTPTYDTFQVGLESSVVQLIFFNLSNLDVYFEYINNQNSLAVENNTRKASIYYVFSGPL